MIRLLLATFLLLLSTRVSAQVTTTVVVNGATVVQVIGTDAGGNPFTQAITTLPPGGVVPTTATPTPTPVPGAGTTAPTSPPATTAPTTTPTSTPSTTTPLTTVNTDTGIQGPVGAPPTTTVGTPGAPIPYVYTTVIGGVTTVIQDIFTPTSPATVSVTPTGSGTILDYSDWLTMNGLSPTNTALTGAGSSLRPAVLGLVLPAVTGVFWMLSSL